jgi:hypothetical protein
LVNLLDDIACRGFNEVQLRFATQSDADPGVWTAWDEASYQANWNFIASTIALARATVASSQVSLWTDIAVELGGISSGQTTAYVKRLWQDYVFVFGTAQTFGASFAVAAGRLPAAIALYDQAGVRPPSYAFDLYDDAGTLLDTLADELSAAGDLMKPVIVQESYYDDATENAEIRSHAMSKNLSVRTLMQWPNARGSGIANFSMDFASSYAAYMTP